MHVVLKHLSNPRLYISEINKLHAKWLGQGKLFSKEDEISFYQISLHRNKFAKLLAKSIKKKIYNFEINQSTLLAIGSKTQTILVNSLTDRIVHGALFKILSTLSDSLFNDSLCSYRKGKSCFGTIKQLRQYIIEHKKNNQHGHVDLYVIKTDIKNYANTVPMHENSPVWECIIKLLKHIDNKNPICNYLFKLIQDSVNPVYINQEGILSQAEQGLPYGTQICSLIYNLYIYELDHQLNTIPSLFYMRYCDDMILIHTEEAKVLAAYKRLSDQLKQKSLSINEEKSQLIYLTIPGKPSPNQSSFIGSNKIDFLGFSVQASGSIRIKKRHTKAFMKQIHHRIKVVAHQSKFDSLEQRAYAICNAVKIVFNKNHNLSSSKLSRFIELHDDRNQLIQLDHQIALWVAQAITGIRGHSAFRVISYKKLRQYWKLPSLCQIRNKGYMQ